MNILLIDDDRAQLEMKRKMLQHSGHVVVTASGAESTGIPWAEFDVVVLDVLMAQLSGYDTLKAVVRQQTAIPPVIVLTALTLGNARPLFEKAGVDGYVDEWLQKPFALSELIALIMKVAHENPIDRTGIEPRQPD